MKLNPKQRKNIDNIVIELKKKINVDLIWKPIGPIISELWFDMFCYLINVEKIEFFNKKYRLITIQILFGYTSSRWVQNWPC